MKKTEVIKKLEPLAKNAEALEVRVLLKLIIKVLGFSSRRIEGYITLISGFADTKPHGSSSERKGIQYRKKSKQK